MSTTYKRFRRRVGAPRTQSEYCQIDDCGLPSRIDSLCSRHYNKLQVYGSATYGATYEVNIYRLAFNEGISIYRAEQLQNPDRLLARRALNYAIKTGKIVKPLACMGCDSIEPLEGHHERYDWPLAVIFLCKTCHSKWH